MEPLWLSHHHADGRHRCLTLGRLAVCRRCAVLYPAALVTALLALGGLRWPTGLDAVLLWLLPIPAVLDFLADMVGGRHHPRRQVAATLALAVAMGIAWTRVRHGFGDELVWSVVVTYGAICGAAVWAQTGDSSGAALRAGTPPTATTLGADDRLRGDRGSLGSGSDLSG